MSTKRKTKSVSRNPKQKKSRRRNQWAPAPLPTARFAEQTITSVSELLRTLQKQYTSPSELVWFRGHRDAGWDLDPTLLRAPFTIEHEGQLTNRFQQNALPFIAHRPSNAWEWMFLMRHHGCPTRLLDWSESPLVGLFFAVEAHRESDDRPGHLWCLLPAELNALSGLKPEMVNDLPIFGTKATENYLPETLAADRTSVLKPIAAIAKRETGRMTSQLSVFTIAHRDPNSISQIGAGKHVWRFTIPAEHKPAIRRELTYLAISRLTLFPDLDSVAVVAKETLL